MPSGSCGLATIFQNAALLCAPERYREALQSDLSEPARSVVVQQYQGVKCNHDEIGRLRDATKVL